MLACNIISANTFQFHYGYMYIILYISQKPPMSIKRMVALVDTDLLHLLPAVLSEFSIFSLNLNNICFFSQLCYSLCTMLVVLVAHWESGIGL